MDDDFSKAAGIGGLGQQGSGGMDEDEEFCPPENFAIVEPGIYRSAFPMRRNFSYLARIGLRSILTLILEEYPVANTEFNEENGVRLFQFGLEGNKEPFRSMPLDKACQALNALMDTRNHPILVHCNEGKHRTGCVVAMLRRARGWALSSTLDEYLLYASSKARIVDQRFIELFDPAQLALTLEQLKASYNANNGAGEKPLPAPEEEKFPKIGTDSQSVDTTEYGAERQASGGVTPEPPEPPAPKEAPDKEEGAAIFISHGRVSTSFPSSGVGR